MSASSNRNKFFGHSINEKESTLGSLNNKTDDKTRNFENFITKKWVVALFAIICCALWGSAYPCVKTGYKLFNVDQSETMSIILFAGMRFFIAGLMIVLFNLISSRKVIHPKKENTRYVFVLAFVQTVIQYIFFYMGLSKSSGVKSAIVGASNVFLLVLVSCFIFRQERISAQKIIGCIIGFLGVVLISMTKEGMGALNLTGDGFIFISSICYAVSSCLIKKYSEHENPVVLSAYQFMIGGSIMIMTGLIGGGHVSPQNGSALVLLLYMGFISAMSYTLWGILLKYNPPSSVAIYGFANPIFGTMLSALFLNESDVLSGLKCILALVLVSIGVIVVNYQKAQRVSYE